MKRKSKKKKNREYVHILGIFTGLFVLMIAYLVYFQVTESRKVINNSYNARLETFEKQVIRGMITARDGQALAYTKTSEDGSEKRIYPFGCTFSHVLGYSEYGRTGMEELGNFQLLTSNAPFWEKFLHDLQDKKDMGDTLVTTLDVDLQTAAHDALGTQKGAVVVLEASTGNVLAMVSKPDYNPENISKNWESLEDSVLLNRATQGLYPPGSIFKTVTLLEYLQEHSLDDSYEFLCEGSISTENATIHCYQGKQHGALDLKTAFAKSCNSAFADIGTSLNISSFQNLSKRLLFHTELPLEIPYSKSSFSLSSKDSEALQMMTAIGQGHTLVTPVHMAMLTAAIANDGMLMTPRFLEHTENYKGDFVEKYPVTSYGNLMSVEEAKILQNYLQEVVESGTASALQSESYQAAGKTGTAEYSSNKEKNHAWFIGYVTGEKKTLAVAVLVEETGSGSAYAVPIAKKIFDTYYKKNS